MKENTAIKRTPDYARRVNRLAAKMNREDQELLYRAAVRLAVWAQRRGRSKA